MKLSLAITSYNRFELTLESFSKVINHPLIDEVVIVDDHSDLYVFTQLYNVVAGMRKVKLFRNQENLGMSRNKCEAINKCNNDWVIVFDSDNVLPSEYVNAIPKNLMSNVIYTPVFAEPNFDYTRLSTHIIDNGNVSEYMEDKMFRCSLNTCNYVVNRDKYLEVYRYDPTIKEADTVYFAYLWLKAGYSFYFVPGMKYYHRVHEGSGWLKNRHENAAKAKEIEKLIMEL